MASLARLDHGTFGIYGQRRHQNHSPPPLQRPPIPRGRPETGSPSSNRPPRTCGSPRKPNPTNPATCQLLATIQRPNEPAEAFPSQRKRFSSHKTFQNVFKRFLKPKPTFRRDAGLLSIATGATRRTKSKMSVFCQKKPPYLRQRSQQRRKSSSWRWLDPSKS